MSIHRPDGQRNRHRFGRSAPEDIPVLTAGSKDPLKELYQGRWNQLPTLHKAGTVLVLLLMSAFAGIFLVGPLTHAEGWSRLVEIVAIVACFLVSLLACRVVLVRLVRYFREEESAKNLNGPATKKR